LAALATAGPVATWKPWSGPSVRDADQARARGGALDLIAGRYPGEEFAGLRPRGRLGTGSRDDPRPAGAAEDGRNSGRGGRSLTAGTSGVSCPCTPEESARAPRRVGELGRGGCQCTSRGRRSLLVLGASSCGSGHHDDRDDRPCPAPGPSPASLPFLARRHARAPRARQAPRRQGARSWPRYRGRASVASLPPARDRPAARGPLVSYLSEQRPAPPGQVPERPDA